MGAKFVAAIIGVIILVVLAQTFIFGGGDGSPSVNNPSSIPTATPPINLQDPVLLGQGDAGGGGGTSPSSSSQSTYTVQSGDTLGAIAAQLGVAPGDQQAWINQVLDLNGMEDARQLQAGQELILPGVPQSSSSSNGNETPVTQPTTQPTTQATAVPTPPPSATGTLPTATPGSGGATGVYVVEDGDYPYLIALKHCVDDPDAWVAELLDINGVDANSLSIGQELDLPPGTPPFCGAEGTDNSGT